MRKIIALVLAVSFLLAVKFEGGWKVEEKREFGPENLYDYIDGGAEEFLRAGFRHLVVYFLKKGKREAVVEIYKMKTRDAALGFFEKEDGETMEIADGGKLQPNGLVLVKGRCFVKIYTYETWDGIKTDLLTLASSVISVLNDGIGNGKYELLPKN